MLLQENRHDVNQTHALKGSWNHPSGNSVSSGPVSVSTTALINVFAKSWAIFLQDRFICERKIRKNLMEMSGLVNIAE